MAGVTHLVYSFIQQYGLVAVFLFMLLESALLLHFTPSELVIPFAAALLVHDSLSFVVFVVAATTGGVSGSILAYFLFGRSGSYLLERYGRYLNLSPSALDRGGRIFRRWGEGTVFLCQLLPFFRAVISIPAGIARMKIRKFITYTAAGTTVFVSALTYLAYTGTQAGTPVHRALITLVSIVTLNIAYVRTHLGFVLVGLGIILIFCLLIWCNREWIRTHPDAAKMRTFRLLRGLGVVVGLLFISSPLSVPQAAFSTITWFWDDPRFFVVSLGLSPQLALVLTGVATLGGGLIIYELGQRIPTDLLIRLFQRLQSYFD